MRQPDITRARELLGWEPKVSLDEGLPRTLAYFRAKLGVVDETRSIAPQSLWRKTESQVT